jgi:hypothetical protein
MSETDGRGLGGALRRWLGRGEFHEARELELLRDAAWSAEVGRMGLEVRCARGVLLVTVEGDPEDHLLSPGEAFATSRRGRLAVWALTAARLHLRPCAGCGEATSARAGDGVGEARRGVPLGSSR